MKKFSYYLILLSTLAFQLPALAGEQIIQSFEPGLQHTQEVLKHVPVKVLVTEFLNSKKDNLGKSIGYLLWREALTAVQDQGGAGVIYAHTPDEKQITDLLRKDYHRAAVEIAKSQNTRMALWGQVNEIRDSIYLNSYLTLLPELIGDELSLNLKLQETEENTFAAEISRSRYNFKLIKTSRTRLFDRTVISRVKVNIYSAANRTSDVIETVPKNTALQATDMFNDWFKIKLQNDKTGWVRLNDVDVPPREVFASITTINVRNAPAGLTVLFKRNLHGNYRVLDMRYITGKGLWYKLAIGRRSGWVAGWLVEPRFSLPAVHFMAGLQRYQLKNYKAAEKAFKQFIDMSSEQESHVNLSAAYQLYGASQLMKNQYSSAGISAIQKATTLTPYDPAVYNLRAIVEMGSYLNANKVVSDLKTAFELDRKDSRSVKTLNSLSNLIKDSAFKNTRTFRLLDVTPKVENEIKLLKDKSSMIKTNTVIQNQRTLQVSPNSIQIIR